MDLMMISPKKLIKFARKWQKRAAMGRRRILYPRVVVGNNLLNSTSSNMVSDKGTFVIYTIDERRFVLPLSYLDTYIFQELFKMSEEEFGISCCGPIILPCDSLFMNDIVLLFQRGMTKDLEEALLTSSVGRSSYSNYSSTLHQGQASKQLLICGY